MRVSLALGVMALAGVLEFLLINSRENRWHPAHMSGVWQVLFTKDTESALSWTVVILVMIAFLFAPGRWKAGLVVVGGLAALLIELVDGRVLPSPQNSWAAGILFLLGVLYGVISVLSDLEIFQRAGRHFGFTT